MSSTTVYVISGGAGVSGAQLVRTALAQFTGVDVPVVIVPNVHESDQLEQAVTQASADNAIIVHTLVARDLRTQLINLAQSRQLLEIDLMGQVLNLLTLRLRKEPLGEPGLYRKLREHDLKRIEAIEFAVDHDDGKRIEELPRAEIVLTGVSRSGKTPLSMFLSTMGWKVANVPLINGIEPPEILFEIDSRRVIGLTIEAGQLAAYRKRRQQHLGTFPGTPYTQPQELVNELEFAQRVFKRGLFARVDVTDKPIEESAREVVDHVSRKLK